MLNLDSVMANPTSISGVSIEQDLTLIGLEGDYTIDLYGVRAELRANSLETISIENLNGLNLRSHSPLPSHLISLSSSLH